jgi:hypothetical protein
MTPPELETGVSLTEVKKSAAPSTSSVMLLDVLEKSAITASIAFTTE